MHLLDTTKLQLDIKQDQDAVFIDKETRHLIGYIMRNFGRDSHLLEWAKEISLRVTEWQPLPVRVRLLF